MSDILTNNYIQFNCDDQLLKFYIPRSEVVNLFKFSIMELDNIKIRSLVASIKDDSYYSLRDSILGNIHDVIVYFNKCLYKARLVTVYLEVREKIESASELFLFRKRFVRLFQMDCTIYSPFLLL